jgi:hypothetical protein
MLRVQCNRCAILRRQDRRGLIVQLPHSGNMAEEDADGVPIALESRMLGKGVSGETQG